MDFSDLRCITNDYQDVRLISLKNWRKAPAIAPPDSGGPYVVSQLGLDPTILQPQPDEFLLGKSGSWISLGRFFRLPEEVRRREFIFATAAEVAELMAVLPSSPQMFAPAADENTGAPDMEDLAAALDEAKGQLGQ